MANESPQSILKQFSFKRLLLPIIIGLGVVIFFFVQGFDREAFEAIRWSWKATFWIMAVLVMMAVRHGAYMYRIRVATGNVLSWGKSFDIILLWEFASAATPSVVGGSTVALYLLNKENINMGKTTTVILFTTFLDQLFFIVFAPTFFVLASRGNMFPNDPSCLQSMNINALTSLDDLVYVFIFGYLLLLGYTLLIGYGLFVNPPGLKRLIVRVFSFRLLQRWRLSAWQAGSDMIVASTELQTQGLGFWIKTFGATVVSWSARYLVINCLIMAFTSVDDHFILYARQFVMWVIVLVPATPGGSGIAELTFLAVLCEFIPKGLSGGLAFLWRLFTYYPYLFIGVIVLPRWINRVYTTDE